MPPRSSLLGSFVRVLRRPALMLLLALQGGVSLAPLIEPTERGRLGSHAEERGAHHRYQHDESTCAVCAVRSLHAVPAHTCPPVACERQQTYASPAQPPSPAVALRRAALPRAPPRAA